MHRMWRVPSNVSQSCTSEEPAQTTLHTPAVQSLLRLHRDLPEGRDKGGEAMIHPIERKSYEILSEQFDSSRYDKAQEAVIRRVIHATADFELAASFAFSNQSVERGIEAVKAQCQVVCDVEMVRAGITKYPTTCFLKETKASPTGIPTRSYTAMMTAARLYPADGIFVIGCAPTALQALIELADEEWFRPALVIGLPVGFVGASESKDLLVRSNLPHITNVGNKGGSPAASAAFNALVRMANESISNVT